MNSRPCVHLVFVPVALTLIRAKYDEGFVWICCFMSHSNDPKVQSAVNFCPGPSGMAILARRQTLDMLLDQQVASSLVPKATCKPSGESQVDQSTRDYIIKSDWGLNCEKNGAVVSLLIEHDRKQPQKPSH